MHQIVDMRIIFKKKIKDFYGRTEYASAKIPLQQWYYTIRNRDYRSLAQILEDFGDTAREKGLYIFTLGDGKYKLATSIYFDTGCVYVRFVETASDCKALVCDKRKEGMRQDGHNGDTI